MALNILEEKITNLRNVPKEHIFEKYFTIVTSFKNAISNSKIIGDSDNSDSFIMFFKAFGENYMFVYNLPLGEDIFTQFERINTPRSSKVIFSIPEMRDPIAPFLISACHIEL